MKKTELISPINTFKVDGEILPTLSLNSDSRIRTPPEYTNQRRSRLSTCAAVDYLHVLIKRIHEREQPYMDRNLIYPFLCSIRCTADEYTESLCTQT